jgi:4'-phosphopantetheinyl transferase
MKPATTRSMLVACSQCGDGLETTHCCSSTASSCALTSRRSRSRSRSRPDQPCHRGDPLSLDQLALRKANAPFGRSELSATGTVEPSPAVEHYVRRNPTAGWGCGKRAPGCGSTQGAPRIPAVLRDDPLLPGDVAAGGRPLSPRASARGAGVAALLTNDCRVWLIDPADAPDWCEQLLSEPELTRAESFHQLAARRQFTVATALLKVAVAETVGCDPFDIELRRECPDCRRLHGRPEVVGGTPYVSLSHSGDRVAVAVCAGGPVGVDVEQVNPEVDVESMVNLMLGDAERRAFGKVQGQQARLKAFFHCWTRKESVLKATGHGLRIPMSDVTLAPHGQSQLTSFAGHPELVEIAQIVDLHPGPGYVGAVTVLSARPALVQELDGAEAFAASGGSDHRGRPAR